MKKLGRLQFCLFLIIIGLAGGYENNAVDFKGLMTYAGIIGLIMLVIQIIKIFRRIQDERISNRNMRVLRTN